MDICSRFLEFYLMLCFPEVGWSFYVVHPTRRIKL